MPLWYSEFPGVNDSDFQLVPMPSLHDLSNLFRRAVTAVALRIGQNLSARVMEKVSQAK